MSSSRGAPIPRNYLSKKGGKWLPVRLSDICVLMHNVQEGSKHPEVGFEDAQRTLDHLVNALNRKILLPPDLIESALWSANLLNEAGAFQDFRDRSLDDFIKQVLGKEQFNKLYNTIERKL